MNDVLNLKIKLKEKSDIVNTVYTIAWAGIFGLQFLTTTMMDYSLFIMPYRLCLGIVLLIMVYRFICLQKEEWPDLLFMIFLLFVGIGMLLFRHTKQYFIWSAVIIAAKDVKFDKIVKVAVIVGSLIMLVALVGSQLGLVEDIVHNSRGGHIAHGLGVVYSTDCAAHVLFIIIGVIYLKQSNVRIYDYALLGIVTFAVFELTRARNNTICACILLTATALFNMIEGKLRNQNQRDRFHTGFAVACCLFILFAVAFSLYNTVRWNEAGEWIGKLNAALGGRYSMGYQAYCEYGVRLWGSEIPQFGGGGSSSWPEHYFFLDISYVSVLLCDGLAVFAATMMIFIRGIYRGRRENIFLIGILALISLQCMIEHHMIALPYNYFLLAAFASLKRDECQTSDTVKKSFSA